MLMETRNLAQTYPLAMANEGERVKIIRVIGGLILIKHLIAIGLIEGTELKIVKRRIGAGLVVACGETRLTFGVGIAQQIMVLPVNEENRNNDAN